MIKPVAIGLTPERIANSQIVDYTTRGADQAIKLAGDLQAVQSPPALPDILPEPPPVPVSYLEPFAVRVSGPTQLSASDQREVLDFLRPIATSMEDPEEAEAAANLLRRLRARPEVTFEAATAIDEILARAADRDPTSPPPERPPAAPVPPPPVPSAQPAPLPPPPQSVAAPPPPAPRQAAVPPAAPAAGEEWSVGAFIALLVATVFLWGVVGIVAGLIGRSTPAKRTQANVLLWIGVGIVVVWIVAAAMGGRGFL